MREQRNVGLILLIILAIFSYIMQVFWTLEKYIYQYGLNSSELQANTAHLVTSSCSIGVAATFKKQQWRPHQGAELPAHLEDPA